MIRTVHHGVTADSARTPRAHGRRRRAINGRFIAVAIWNRWVKSVHPIEIDIIIHGIWSSHMLAMSERRRRVIAELRRAKVELGWVDRAPIAHEHAPEAHVETAVHRSGAQPGRIVKWQAGCFNLGQIRGMATVKVNARPQTGVVSMSMTARGWSRCCRRGSGRIDDTQAGRINMTDGVGPWAHGVCVAGHRVLAHTVCPSRSTGAFSAPILRSRRWSGGHVQLLLVPQEEISTGETARTVLTFKWFLLCMRTLVALQMF